VQTELLKKEFGVMNLGKIKDLESGEAFRGPRPGYAMQQIDTGKN